LSEVLELKRKTMPHRSSYQRILETVVGWEEMEQLVNKVLSCTVIRNGYSEKLAAA